MEKFCWIVVVSLFDLNSYSASADCQPTSNNSLTRGWSIKRWKKSAWILKIRSPIFFSRLHSQSHDAVVQTIPLYSLNWRWHLTFMPSAHLKLKQYEIRGRISVWWRKLRVTRVWPVTRNAGSGVIVCGHLSNCKSCWRFRGTCYRHRS